MLTGYHLCQHKATLRCFKHVITTESWQLTLPTPVLAATLIHVWWIPCFVLRFLLMWVGSVPSAQACCSSGWLFAWTRSRHSAVSSFNFESFLHMDYTRITHELWLYVKEYITCHPLKRIYEDTPVRRRQILLPSTRHHQHVHLILLLLLNP